MPAEASEKVNESEPRPTCNAFKLAGKEELGADLFIASILLAGFLLGLLANIFGDFSGFVSASERGINNAVTPILLQVLVYFGFSLFLIGAAYFI